MKEALAMLAAAALLPGCVCHHNERLAIGTRATTSFREGPAMTMAGPGTPDRARWRTMIVVAPIDGVVHAEPFRLPRPISRRSGPERAGVFPTPDRPRRGDHDWFETAQDIGRSAFDPLLAPRRAWRAGRSGWWTWSPREVWKRERAERRRTGTVGGRPTEIDDDR